MSSGFERLHYLLESAFDADGDLSPAFLKARRTVTSSTIIYHPCVLWPAFYHPTTRMRIVAQYQHELSQYQHEFAPGPSSRCRQTSPRNAAPGC